MCWRRSISRERQLFRRLLRHITSIHRWPERPAAVRCGRGKECALKRIGDGVSVEHGQHALPQTEHGQADFYRCRTGRYVANGRPIMREFAKEGRPTPHNQLSHITAGDWRNGVTRLGGPNRRAKGVRSQCRRSLTLVENSLNPVEEIMSVPGAHAVPPLVQPTGGP